MVDPAHVVDDAIVQFDAVDQLGLDHVVMDSSSGFKGGGVVCDAVEFMLQNFDEGEAEFDVGGDDAGEGHVQAAPAEGE